MTQKRLQDLILINRKCDILLPPDEILHYFLQQSVMLIKKLV